MGLFDLAKSQLFGNKEAPGLEQSEEDRRLAAKIRADVEQCRSAANRIAHEGIWMTNVAYCLGYDGVAFNSTTRQFQPINRATSYLKKNRIHVNKILPTLQNRLARLCKNPPKYDVLPESNTQEDKDAARLAIQTLNALWSKMSLNEKRLLLYMWVQQAGHAYIKIAWDPMLGNMMPSLDEEGPQPESVGADDHSDPEKDKPSQAGTMDWEGDIRADICSPFEVFPNPLAKNFEEVLRSWLIHAKVRKLDYFKDNFPEKGHLVKEESAWLLSIQYENRINSLNSRGPSQGGMQDQMKDAAIELIKYEAPTRQRPNGRMIVTANGILLEDKDLPCGEIPFAKFDDILIGGKYYSEAVTTHLRPLQDYYNEIVRKRSDWTRKMLAGKYAAARGSGLQQESMNDESGEVVYYDPIPGGGPPTPMAIPSIPQYAYNEEDKVIGMFNDISGISEVSRGQMPSASIPAIGMQLLTEQDDTRIGVMTEQHEHAWSRVGKLILKYVEDYYQMPRKLKIAGPNMSWSVKEMSGQDLKGNTDVVVVRGSTLPGSKTLRRQEILNTMQMGLLGDPKDPKVAEKVLGMIEFGDVQDLWLDYSLDMNQIRRGMDDLKQGMSVEVNIKDNNPLWIVELNRFRKTEEYQKADPQVQMLIEDQITQRSNAIIEANKPPPMPPPEEPAGGPPGAPPPPPQG